VTDQELLTELQYALLEPPDGGQSWPSEVWTRAEVIEALASYLRSLLRETHLIVTSTEIAVLANATSVALPTDWMATAHLVWRAADNTRTPLGPADAFEGDLAIPGWEATTGLPLAYADLDRATLTLRLIPTPAAAGTVELLYIAQPAALSGAGTTIPVSDEFISGIKYGALGWLLRKVGRLQDPERATYCERRYDLTRIAAEIILGGWA
jgi:hypothetical protein